MAITVSVDATVNVSRNTSNPTISITPVTGDTMIVCCVFNDNTLEGDVTSVSDDQNGTYSVAKRHDSATWRSAAIYYITNPAITATTITVNTEAACDTVIDAFTLQGTKTTSPIGNTAGEDLASTHDPSLVINQGTANSCLVYCAGNGTNATYDTFGSGQVERGQGNNGGAEKFSAMFTTEIRAATGNDTQSANASTEDFGAEAAAEILEDTGGGDPNQRFTMVNQSCMI